MNGKEGKSEVIMISKDMLAEKTTQKEVVVLLDIDYTIFHTARFKESGLRDYAMYPGDLKALGVLAELADLGIFSQEVPTIDQIRKLDETGTRKYFPSERVHLHTDKLAEIGRVFERYKTRKKVVIVDDKLSVLAQAKSVNPTVYAIWMNRGPYANKQPEIEGFKPDAEVKELAEVVPLVQNLCAEFLDTLV